MKILVTGGAGFIGSHFIKHALRNNWKVKGFCRNTNIRAFRRIMDFISNKNFNPIYGDLLGDISGLCEDVDVVVNFAAKTFVDHSIVDPTPFVEANTLGTLALLEESRRQKVDLFIQISTDEVYGSILEGAYKEDSRINPTNPYSASKAGADALVISYAYTFDMNTIVTRTENNYGPWQHPQKAIPVFTRKALDNELIPVYGDGQHVRQWLYVEDHVDAILKLIGWGLVNKPKGEVFHVAGNQELTNLQLARKILTILSKPENQIEFIPDHDIRPGHDRRYALDCTKIKETIDWDIITPLEEGLHETVSWYKDNPHFWI